MIPPARDGVEQRLDAILAELRAIRLALQPKQTAPPPTTKTQPPRRLASKGV